MGDNYPELLEEAINVIRKYIGFELPANDIIDDMTISTLPFVSEYGTHPVLSYLKAEVTYQPHWDLTNTILGIKR
jgi:hypothetical protein